MMATPAEIANDLRAQAAGLQRRVPEATLAAMRRGALAIDQLRERVRTLEAEALRRDAGRTP